MLSTSDYLHNHNILLQQSSPSIVLLTLTDIYDQNHDLLITSRFSTTRTSPVTYLNTRDIEPVYVQQLHILTLYAIRQKSNIGYHQENTVHPTQYDTPRFRISVIELFLYYVKITVYAAAESLTMIAYGSRTSTSLVHSLQCSSP